MLLRPIVLFVTAAAACFAQASDSWLMQNYRFAGPPAPGEIQAVNPTIADLQEIQTAILTMMHKAKVAGDYEAALAAAAQAAANAQLMANLSGQLQRPPAPPPPAAAPPKPVPSRFLIALQDRTIHPATSVWADRVMLHFTTREGAHEQVRLDLVDWKRSDELNRTAP